VREENEEADNEQPDVSDYYLSQKRPLLGKSVIQYRPTSFGDEEEGDDQNDTLTSKNNDHAFNNANRLEVKNELNPPSLSSKNNNNSKI